MAKSVDATNAKKRRSFLTRSYKVSNAPSTETRRNRCMSSKLENQNDTGCGSAQLLKQAAAAFGEIKNKCKSIKYKLSSWWNRFTGKTYIRELEERVKLLESRIDDIGIHIHSNSESATAQRSHGSFVSVS